MTEGRASAATEILPSLQTLARLSRMIREEARIDLGEMQAGYLDRSEPVPAAVLDLWRLRVESWEGLLRAHSAAEPAVREAVDGVLRWLGALKPEAGSR